MGPGMSRWSTTTNSDQSIAACVSWAPDIYNLSDVKGNKLIVTSATANKLIADVWFARADFAKDHPDIIEGLVRGIFDAMIELENQPAKQEVARLMADGYSIPADECLAMLGDAHSTNYAENRESIRSQIQELEEQRRAAQTAASGGLLGKPERKTISMDVVDHVARTIVESSDPDWGGWGREHKFPHPEAIDFALIRWSQTGDKDMYSLVTRTLRNMQEGEIHDRVEGGFYRYATQPDWSLPHHEKMLDSNAQRLFAYIEAYQALGELTPLSHSVANTVKRVVIILASVAVFKNPITPLGQVSAAIAILGTFIYSVVVQQDKEKAAKAAAAAKAD